MAEAKRLSLAEAWLSPLVPVATPTATPAPADGTDFARELERAGAVDAGESAPAVSAAPATAAPDEKVQGQDPAATERAERSTPDTAARTAESAASDPAPQGPAKTAVQEALTADSALALRRLDVGALPLKTVAETTAGNLAAGAASQAKQQSAQTILAAIDTAAPTKARTPATSPVTTTSKQTTRAKGQAEGTGLPAASSPPARGKSTATEGQTARSTTETGPKGTGNEPHTEAVTVSTTENRATAIPTGAASTGDLAVAQVKAEATSPASGPSLAFLELRDQVLSKVRSGIVQLADKGDSRVIIRLYPPELGKVQVDMTVGERGISVKINAESQAVREVILTNADVLKGQVENAGHTVQDLSVEVGNFRDPSADGQGRSFSLGSRSGGGNGEGGDTGGSQIPDGVATSPLAASGWLGRAINLIV